MHDKEAESLLIISIFQLRYNFFHDFFKAIGFLRFEIRKFYCVRNLENTLKSEAIRISIHEYCDLVVLPIISRLLKYS